VPDSRPRERWSFCGVEARFAVLRGRPVAAVSRRGCGGRRSSARRPG
jgi:hypothetical protein